MVGAADIKMVGCIVAAIGINNGIKIILLSMFFAGIYSFYKMIKLNIFFKRIKYIFNFLRGLLIGVIYEYEKNEEAQIRLGIFFALGSVVWGVVNG